MRTLRVFRGVKEEVRGVEDPPRVQTTMGGSMERDSGRRGLFMGWSKAWLLMMAMLLCLDMCPDTKDLGLTHLNRNPVDGKQLVDKADQGNVYNVGPKMQEGKEMSEIEMMGRIIDAPTCHVRCSTGIPFSLTSTVEN
jgi:hypothetical protein